MTEVEPIPKKTRRKKTDAAKAKAEADRLCGALVRARGACERCSKRENLQWAHIIRRNYAATRVNPEAAWCLCASCHWATEKDAVEFVLLLERTIGVQRYEELRAIAKAGVKTSAAFWQAQAEALRERGAA